MKMNKLEIVKIALIACLTAGAINVIAACGSSDSSDDDKNKDAISALSLDLNASCDGKACL